MYSYRNVWSVLSMLRLSVCHYGALPHLTLQGHSPLKGNQAMAIFVSPVQSTSPNIPM